MLTLQKLIINEVTIGHLAMLERIILCEMCPKGWFCKFGHIIIRKQAAMRHFIINFYYVYVATYVAI